MHQKTWDRIRWQIELLENRGFADLDRMMTLWRKKSRLRLLDDRLDGVINELRHFADGNIEQEDGDHVWVKAIGMKGPDFILQFHKLGIDLNQVYCTLINPGKNLDRVAEDAQAEAPDAELDQVDAAQGDDDLIPDCTGRVITIDERDKYLLLVDKEYQGRSNAQARVDLLNRKGIPVYVESRQYPYGGEWTGKKFTDNRNGAKERLGIVPTVWS